MKEIKPVENNLENKQPSNLEAEQALLGSILVNNDIIDEISTLVKSNIFYVENLFVEFFSMTFKILFHSFTYWYLYFIIYV